MADEHGQRYNELLDGTYDCVDRIVLNAYNRFCYSAGGFREWWRRLMNGSDEHLDNAHLMRMAGRFSRRVRGFAKAHGLPVIDCRRGERKHDLAEEYLATHTVKRGLFLILVGRAEVPLWDVRRAGSGSILLKQKKAYVNHYSFHCAARLANQADHLVPGVAYVWCAAHCGGFLEHGRASLHPSPAFFHCAPGHRLPVPHIGHAHQRQAARNLPARRRGTFS